MLTYLQIIVFAISIVIMSACSSNDKSNNTQPTTLIWRSCTDQSAVECAELKVPVDYQNSFAGVINIGISHLSENTQPAKRAILV